jgi:hypothetical protein
MGGSERTLGPHLVAHKGRTNCPAYDADPTFHFSATSKQDSFGLIFEAMSRYVKRAVNFLSAVALPAIIAFWV